MRYHLRAPLAVVVANDQVKERSLRPVVRLVMREPERAYLPPPRPSGPRRFFYDNATRSFTPLGY